ncbi:MAG: NCS2 family nucleobase:cation symporter [Spirochaetales bacterium]|nr:NCS2 family nucleobase:cation symporter [Spirochaetales bacterium]
MSQSIPVDVRPPLRQWIPLSLQHVFAMFGATVLVPILTGLSPSVALFTSGIGTLLYILVTKGKVPAYLGSSFAFIAPIVAVSTNAAFGVAYAMGAAFCVGLLYLVVSFIISRAGTAWIDRVLPPVVIGSVIMVIGLKLAPTAMNMAMNAGGGIENYHLSYLLIAGVTLGIAVVSSIVLKGFFNVIPILIGIVGGYLFTFFMGLAMPESAFALISFDGVKEAAWFGFTTPVLPKFHWVPIVSFLLVSLVTMSEHLGDTMVLSKVVGKDLYREPGLHRTMMGDGLATSLAAFFGGPPNTTYGENIGVLAITGVHSVWVTGGAAVVAILLSFIQKFGALIQTIPTPVMGGVSMMLFGIIASAGIRTVVESGVDYGEKRNLTISSVILVIGIGGGLVRFPISNGLNFELTSMALAVLVGILLNLALPKTLNDVSEDSSEEMIEHELEKQAQNS